MNATGTLSAAIAQVIGSTAGAVALAEGEGMATAGLEPERVLTVPVCDRAAAGLALGLALGGRRPVVEVTSAGRLAAMIEVLREAVAIAAGGEFRATMILRVAWGQEAGERLDGGMLDVLTGLEGLTVVCPRDPAHAGALLEAAMSRPGPTVLLETRALGRRVGAISGAQRSGGCEVIREGGHVTLASFGASLEAVSMAAEALAASGIEAEVVDLVTLAPLDGRGLGALVQQTGRLIVAAPRAESGFARRVARTGLDAAFLYLEAPLVAVPDDDVSALVAAATRAVRF